RCARSSRSGGGAAGRSSRAARPARCASTTGCSTEPSTSTTCRDEQRSPPAHTLPRSRVDRGRRVSRILVVGAGLSGLACALRLADGGAPVTVIATGAGSLQLGGATIDLLGYAPALVREPLDALAGLPADHTYSVLGRDRVVAATGWLAERLPALRLHGDGGTNMLLATA